MRKGGWKEKLDRGRGNEEKRALSERPKKEGNGVLSGMLVAADPEFMAYCCFISLPSGSAPYTESRIGTILAISLF